MKTGTPRLYGIRGTSAERPEKWSALKVSDAEAFLASSLPPFEEATAQPLRIRTDPSLSIAKALHSALALTPCTTGQRDPHGCP